MQDAQRYCARVDLRFTGEPLVVVVMMESIARVKQDTAAAAAAACDTAANRPRAWQDCGILPVL